MEKRDKVYDLGGGRKKEGSEFFINNKIEKEELKNENFLLIFPTDVDCSFILLNKLSFLFNHFISFAT